LSALTPLRGPFSKRLIGFILLQLAFLFGVIWIIAGNDRLFRRTVPIEQRLVSKNETIRKKAQQELLGLDMEGKKAVVNRLIPALDQGDAFSRKWAAISLALMGPAAQEAIPFLMRNVSLSEKDVVQATKVALSEIGAPDIQQLPSLLNTLQDPRESVRCEAAIAMGKMGATAQEAVPLLLGYIRRSAETPACFETALASLSSNVPSIAPSTVELLGSGYRQIRLKASRILGGMTLKSPPVISAVLRVVETEKDPEVRRDLFRALAMPETTPLRGPALLADVFSRSHNESVRLTGLEALRLAHPPAAEWNSFWGQGLQDSSPDVRFESARWIRESGQRGKKLYRLIPRMLRDPEPSIRRLGLETLRRSGLRSTELLQRAARAQKDGDPGVRCRAVEALVELGSVDRISTALLIEDLKKDEDTGRCAVEALGQAGHFEPEVVRSMIHLLETERNADFRGRAASVLIQLGPKAREALPALVRAAKDQVPGAELAVKAIRTSLPRRRH
jgi:HEAT repeat protein